MKNKSIARSISFISAFLLLVTCLVGVPSLSVTTNAMGGGSTGDSSLGGSPSSKIEGEPAFANNEAGYRIYIAPRDLVDEDNKTLKHVSTRLSDYSYYSVYELFQTESGGYLDQKDLYAAIGDSAYKICVLDKTNAGKSGVIDGFSALLKDNNEGKLTSVRNGAPDLKAFGYTKSYGTASMESLSDWSDYVFSSLDTAEELDAFLENYKNALKAKGFNKGNAWSELNGLDHTNFGSDKNSDYVVVVEPVVIWAVGSSAEAFAFGYTNRSDYFENWTVENKNSYYTNKYLGILTKYIAKVEGVSQTSTPGFAVYYDINKEPNKYHASTNVILSYDGNVQTVLNDKKNGKTSVITNKDYSTVLTRDKEFGSDLTFSVEDIKSATEIDTGHKLVDSPLDSWGTEMHRPRENSESSDTETVISRLLGTTTDWEDQKYMLVKYSTYMAKQNAGTFGTDNLYNTDALNDIHVTTSTSAPEGDYSIGDVYSIDLDDTLWGIASSVSPAVSTDEMERMYDVVHNDSATLDTTAILTNIAAYGLKNSALTAYGASNYRTESEDIIPISVEFLVKEKIVSSYLVEASFSNGTPSLESNEKTSYNVLRNGTFDVDTDAKNNYLVMFQDSDGGEYKFSDNPSGSNLLSALAGNIYSGTNGVSNLKSDLQALGIQNVVVKKLVNGSTKVGVGAGTVTGTDGKITLEGYDVFVLSNSDTYVAPETGNMSVKDYELNYVYPTVLGENNNSSLISVLKDNYIVDSYHTGTNHSLSGIAVKDSHIDNSITISKGSGYGGAVINHNNTLGSNKNLFFYRLTGLFKPEALSTKSFSNSEVTSNDVVLNHAVNLVRGVFGDDMAVSSMHPTTSNNNEENFLINNLGLRLSNKGNISSVASSVDENNSDAILANIHDTFQWTASRKLTQLKSSLCYYQVSVPHTGYTIEYTFVKVADITIPMPHFVSYTYYTEETRSESVLVPVAVEPLSNGSSQATYNVTESCNKYVPVDRTCAVNSKKTIEVVKAVDGFNTSSFDGVITYKSASVHSSDKTLNFYPEVAYRAYKPLATDTLDFGVASSAGSDRNGGSSQVSPMTVWMMGEKVRTVKPSGLYLMTVEGTGNTNNISGTVDSETVASGSDAKALSQSMNNLQVIYAGGNVNLQAKANFKINLTGFALDTLDKSLDDHFYSGTYATDSNKQVYDNVVADNSNIKTDWDNSSYSAMTEYSDWVKSIIDNLDVDVTLKTTRQNGTTVKSYSNFSTSIGRKEGGETKSEKVYNIQFVGGGIVKDATYNKLMTEIASKYFNTSSPTSINIADAEILFKNSGVYQTILQAIEDVKDSDNDSQVTSFSGGQNWYDEVVRTFVIREFETSAITLPNITVSSKIDINAGPSQSTTSRDGNFTNGYYGKWYLSVYLKDAPDTFTNPQIFKSALDTDSLNSANDTGTVLASRVYINGSDFIISNATTAEMRN